MKFFAVWWFDLLLAITLLAQIGVSFADRRGLGGVLRGAFAVLTVLLELGLVISLLFIGGALTDVLIVLMICTLVSAAAAMLDGRLAQKGRADSSAAIGAEEGSQQ